MPRLSPAFLLALAAAAQPRPDAAAILQNVGQLYKPLTEYELNADLRRTGQTNTIGHLHFAFKAPDRYRLEGALPGQSAGGVAIQGVVVYDGSALWYYLPSMNVYGSIPAAEMKADAAGDIADTSPAAMDHFLTWRYRGAAAFAGGARFLREESMLFGPARVECYVISVQPEPGGSVYTWWVDKQLYRILREDDPETSSVFTSIKLSGPLPEGLFKFVTPAGARKIDRPK